MTYFRKRSLILRHWITRHFRTLRRMLQRIDLSLSVEINLVVIKVSLTIKRPAA